MLADDSGRGEIMIRAIRGVAMILSLLAAGCSPTLPIASLSGPNQLAYAEAEQQCQLVHRHARWIASDTMTGRASFQCLDS
jgi:hypothetical protein